MVIDVSSSQPQDKFGHLKTFLEGIINELDVSVNGTHVGLVTFSSSATTKVSLSHPSSKDVVLQVR